MSDDFGRFERVEFTGVREEPVVQALLGGGIVLGFGLTGVMFVTGVEQSGGGWAVVLVAVALLAMAGVRWASRRAALRATSSRLELSRPFQGPGAVELDQLNSVEMQPDVAWEPSEGGAFGYNQRRLYLADDLGSRLQMKLPNSIGSRRQADADEFLWSAIRHAIAQRGLVVAPALRDSLDHLSDGPPLRTVDQTGPRNMGPPSGPTDNDSGIR